MVIHYRTSAAEAAGLVETLRGQSVSAIALAADLTDERSVGKLIEQTLAHFGRLDVLVNCAAVWGRKNLEEVTAEDVRHQFDQHPGDVSVFATSGPGHGRPGRGRLHRDRGRLGRGATLSWLRRLLSLKGAIPTLTRTLAVELGATRGCASIVSSRGQ